MTKILQDDGFTKEEILEGIDEAMGRPPKPLYISEGALVHLARYVEAVAGLPGDDPLYMRQNVRLEDDAYWYRVEVKIERLGKVTPLPEDFREEDYPEHIYPDWMVQPPLMAPLTLALDQEHLSEPSVPFRVFVPPPTASRSCMSDFVPVTPGECLGLDALQDAAERGVTWRHQRVGEDDT